MEWTYLIIAISGFVLTIGGTIVTISLKWGKIDTRIALIELCIKTIQENHLKHIEISMNSIARDLKSMSEKIIRIEEKIK